MHLKKTGGQGISWHAIGLDTYALSPGNVAVWHYDHGKNDWVKIAEHTKEIACAGGRLFRLTNDHKVERWSNNKWTEVAHGYIQLIEGGDLLFAISHNNDIHMYDGSHFHKIGGPGGHWTAVGDHVIGISPGADTVYAYTVGGSWVHVGTGYKELISGGKHVFGIAHNGDIHQWHVGTPHKWTKVGGPGTKFVSTQTGLYGVNHLGDIWRWSGNGEHWDKVGSGTKNIWGSGTASFPLVELTNGDAGILTHY